MNKPEKSLESEKSQVAKNPESQKQESISTSLLNLTKITSELSVDIQKLDTYIMAIKRLTDGKFTPYDEVNELKEILEKVQQNSEIIKQRYSSLLLFLSVTKEQLLESDVVDEGDSDE